MSPLMTSPRREGRIQEDCVLFFQELTGQETDEDIFNVQLDLFMETGDVCLENCIAICMDGASAMTECKNGLVSWAKEANPMKLATHCMLHRQTLASKSFESWATLCS